MDDAVPPDVSTEPAPAGEVAAAEASAEGAEASAGEAATAEAGGEAAEASAGEAPAAQASDGAEAEATEEGAEWR